MSMVHVISPNSWELYFIKMAQLVSTKSKDPSTKVGAVCVGKDNEVISTGFNGFPRGIAETRKVTRSSDEAMWGMTAGTELISERWERPEKYKWVEHSERNCIYNAARIGVSLKGTTLYQNYYPGACADCARAIIQVGIERIVGPEIPFPGKGAGTSYDIEDVGASLLNEAGISRFVVPISYLTNAT